MATKTKKTTKASDDGSIRARIERPVKETVDRIETRTRELLGELRRQVDEARDSALEQVRERTEPVRRLRKAVDERLERGRNRLLHSLGLASHSEVEKLEKRLSSLSTKVGQLTKAQGNGAAKKGAKKKTSSRARGR